MSIIIQWLTTAPRPRARYGIGHPDAGTRGWVRHAVMASDAETFGAIKHRRAECGLIARHGWALDLFIETNCKRCSAVITKARGGR